MLLNGDCLVEMEKIEDKSVSLFLLDLPFGCTKKKWDIPIDLTELWVLIKKKMKKDANILFFCTTSFGFNLIEANQNWFAYDLCWEKTRPTGFLNCRIAPLRAHESIYLFKKGKTCFNPQMELKDKPITQKRKVKKRSGGIYNNFIEIEERTYTHSYPKSVLKFGSVNMPIHSSQKPSDLLEYLINTYSNEGDLVCDPTCGSGSVGVACAKLNRPFIGIEKDEAIFNLAKQILKEKI